MDELEWFYARLDDLTDRLFRLCDGGHDVRAGESGGWKRASALVIEESLEALRIAGEELRQQDELLQNAVVALEAERQAMWELFDLAFDNYVITDARGTIRAVNQAAVAWLARPGHPLTGMPLANFVVPSERRAFRAALNELGAEERIAGWKFHFEPRGEGRPCEAALSAAVVRDHAGRPTSVRWLIRNAGERRRDEPWEHDALRARAYAAEAELARYCDLVEGIDTVVWEAGADGRLNYINRRVEELLGYPVARWLNEPGLWADLVHPDDREWASEQRRRALRLERDQELEYRLIAADGRVIWFRESIRVRCDAAGGVMALRGTLWSIGRRKKVERRLYMAKREIAASLADLAYLHELGGRLVATSEFRPLLSEVLDGVLGVLGAELGIIRLYDPERDELVAVASTGLPDPYLERYERVPRGIVACGLTAASSAATIIEDVETDPAYAPSREAAALGGFRAVYSAPLLDRSGALLGTVAACFVLPHRPHERQVQLVGLFARQAADLIHNARRLEEVCRADRTKGDFLALLAHELRNPLATILNTTYALDPDQPAPEAVAGARQVIWRQSVHMSRLITELLDAARLRGGDLALRKRAVDMADVVQLALEATRAQLERRRHTLDVQLPDEPATLEADPDRLRQLVENLVGNAAKYTEPGGQIVLTVEADAREVRLCVRDNGIGIPADLLPRIFEPYMQADSTPGRAQGGLGIGLALVKSIVEGHGGRVIAESAGVGQGAAFTVFLPRGATPLQTPPPAESPLPPPLVSERPDRPLRLLVVDDNTDSARSLAYILTLWGHDVAVATNGPEALELARSFHPAIALVDIGMPGMDGYEVAQRLRQDIAEPCVLIALTGYASEEERRPSDEADFAHYLVKPADLDELRRLVEQVGRAL